MCGVSKMAKELGEKSFYPHYYKIVKGFEIQGGDESEAIEKAKEAIYEQLALYKNALDKGFKGTKKEVNQYVESLLNDAKNTKQYKVMDKVCKELGTTFDAEYKNNKWINNYMVTLNKWGKSLDNKNYDKKDIKKLTDKILSEFKKEDAYKSLSQSLKYCREAYEKFGSNVKEIKKNYGDKLDFQL